MSLPMSWTDPDLIDATERVPFQPDFEQADALPPSPDAAGAKIDLVAASASRRSLPPPIPVRALKSSSFPIVPALGSRPGTVPPPIPVARARTQSSPPPIPTRALKPSVSTVGDGSIDVDMSSLQKEVPLPRAPRRGTAPPPFRAPTEHPFIVYPAPPAHGAAAPSAVFFEAPAAALPRPTAQAASESGHFDPTPLPRPYVDLTGDAWFEMPRDVEHVDAFDPDIDSYKVTTSKRWLVALVLFVSVIAVVAFGTRAFLGSRPDVAPRHSSAVATAHPVEHAAVAPAAAIAPRAAEPVAAQPVAQPAPSEPVAEEKPEPAAAPAVAAQPTPSEPVTEQKSEPPAAHESVATSKPAVATKTSKRVAASHSSSRGDAKPHRSVAAASAPARTGGRGILMLSSKPPCEIVIDGVPTARTTPQRSLPLSAGNHKVKLLNAEHRINATFEIVIEGRKTTKLIRDFTKK